MLYISIGNSFALARFHDHLSTSLKKVMLMENYGMGHKVIGAIIGQFM